jgi:hypothetical protein
VTGVQRLLAEFIQEHAGSGIADPRGYLARAAPPDRTELSDLIDGYLSRAPRQRFDPARFAGSPAERIVQDLEPIVLSPAGWKVLLPQLRQQAELKRSDLVARLAEELDLTGKQDKVAGYYHEMEQGRLAPEGVSDRVLDVLGNLLGRTREALRAAGRPSVPPPSFGPVAAFARSATSAEVGSPVPSVPEAETWDEVDELFRGR